MIERLRIIFMNIVNELYLRWRRLLDKVKERRVRFALFGAFALILVCINKTLATGFFMATKILYSLVMITDGLERL